MTEQEISLLAGKIVNDTKFWIALVGVIGAIVGSALTLVGNFAIEWYKGRNQKKIDTARQKLLEEMLQDKTFQWRNLSTLAAVIGCDEEQTKNHLITIGARGSENNDGKWGLISRHPLTEIRRSD
ncbi:MAG: hypothetical protein PHF56_12795 [Desulfuromonadaceae bacterium]|nr:hypothetical protein [Desulfuromonadaceae bacterium]